MDQQGTTGLDDLKKDRSHAAQPAEKSAHAATEPSEQNSISQLDGSAGHGVNGALPNGIPHVNGTAPPANGSSEQPAPSSAGESRLLPPELDQTWRETAYYKPLGTLMERLAQQCYYDLNETIDKMAQIEAPQNVSSTNGTTHNASDPSAESVQKKLLLMHFAQNQRDRFIKTLVLSDWARNVEDLDKLIDLKVWADKQQHAHDDSARAIGQTKLNMIGAKMPNPNIHGALQLLATGNAPWMPDLGYIPPKRLTAKQLLKTLQSMNVTLATRLNLHEELPIHFDDFTIANGRATFTVPDEFEVDISVADEDPTSQFYFIDIRLLFSPTSNALDDRLREPLERTVNEMLAAKGLQGCYEILHNFVLTHKINVLRQQAGEMVRSKWFDRLRVEPVRRSLTLQYWSSLPGPKSWIEIGVVSGKEKVKGLPRSLQNTPRIGVKWFRRSVEVEDEVLTFDWKQLDMERDLMKVIQKHSTWVLEAIQDRILTLSAGATSFAAELRKAEDCKLLLRLPSMEASLVVRQEPVTGCFALSPATEASNQTEQRLNSDPSIDVARWLAALLCAMLQQRVACEAEQVGWQLTPVVFKQENLKAVFGIDVLQCSFFVGRGWGSEWAIGVTFNLSGEKWWIVRLDNSNQSKGTVVASAKSLSVRTADSKQPTLSQAALLRIERLAVAQMCFTVLAQELRSQRIRHELEAAIAQPSGKVVMLKHSVHMAIKFSDLMRDPSKKEWKPWANEFIRLAHLGLQRPGGDPARVRHEIRLLLDSTVAKDLRTYLTQDEDRDIALHSSGGCSILIRSPLGVPLVEQMQTRLRSVERLSTYVSMLKERQFRCESVSLSRLVFNYDKIMGLRAELQFSADGTLPIHLQFEPQATNPHQRIKVLLEQSLNRGGDNAFKNFTMVLAFTLPLLRAFERIEDTDSSRQLVSIHLRSPTWYSLKYKAPLPQCNFQIRARIKSQGAVTSVKWHVEPDRTQVGLPEGLVKALVDLSKEKGDGWAGFSGQIFAGASGIEEALRKVDETVRRFEVTEGKKETSASNATGENSSIAANEAKKAKTAEIDHEIITLD